MRLVTWNLGLRLNGGHAPDDVFTALAALEPDIIILTEHLSGPARKSFLASLADLGLTHQLAAAPVQHGSHVLIASRLELEPGQLKNGATRDQPPPNMLHAYAPSGVLTCWASAVRIRSAGPTSTAPAGSGWTTLPRR